MQRDRKRVDFGRTAKAVGAALLVVLVLVLGAFSASPTLHHQLHPDSTRPDHYCLITAFANGQLGVTEALPVLVAAILFLLCGTLLPATPLVSLFCFQFSRSRAPPRV